MSNESSAATASPRRWRWNGLWRRGAGTKDDPDNGRLIFRLTGINAWLYCRRFDTNLATLRGLYWWLLRRYETELCQHCGRPVRIVYHAPDAIWEAVTGLARHPDGHAAPGILCPRCLDDLADAKGLPYLRWTCSTSDEVMYGRAPRSSCREARWPWLPRGFDHRTDRTGDVAAQDARSDRGRVEAYTPVSAAGLDVGSECRDLSAACVCGEINTRHCPVHGQGEVETAAHTARRRDV